MAYSAVGSAGISILATDGDCGRVEGRGILFDREAPCETKLQSFAVREPKPAVNGEELERFAWIGKTKWILAPGRLERVGLQSGVQGLGNQQTQRWRH